MTYFDLQANRAAVLAVIIAAMPFAGWAQTYPTSPIKLIVGFAERGAGDSVARLISDKLARALGQPVTVENRIGGNGAVAAQMVARAAPDGHILLVGQTGDIVVNQFLVKNLEYNPEKDLQPVALAASFPEGIVAQANAPFSTVDEMLQYSRSSKRGLLFASSGPGTPGHLAGEILRLRTLSRLTHVPYDGAGRAIEGLLAGQVDIFISSLPAATPHVASGQLKIVAVSSAKRSLLLPNVPTVSESGIKDFAVTNWVGIFAPRATPKEIVAKLNREINQALAQQDVRDRLMNDAADITLMSPDQFAGFVKTESGKYADLMREAFCSRLLFGGCEGFSQLP